MKSLPIFFCFLLLGLSTLQAQRVRLEMGVANVFPLGDFAKSDASLASAGYVEYGLESSFQLTLRASSGWVSGIRVASTEYWLLENAYAARLLNSVAATDMGLYNLSGKSLRSASLHINLGYEWRLGERVGVEPYINFGLDVLEAGKNELYYMYVDHTQYMRQAEWATTGFSFQPGLRISWGFSPNLALFLYGSYHYAMLREVEYEQLVVEPAYLRTTWHKTQLTPQYATAGLGFTYSIGKKQSQQ